MADHSPSVYHKLIVENSKSSYTKILGQRYNSVNALRVCYIKLRRIKSLLNVNNSRCMNATAAKKSVVSKVPLVLHSSGKCEETLPFMSLNQERKGLNKTGIKAEYQMLESLPRFLHLQKTQTGCKNLVVKVKRLRVEKQHSKLKPYNNGLSNNNQGSERSESGNTVALQDQCALNLSEKSKKSKLRVSRTIKKEVVKLKHFKPRKPIRPLTTTALPIESENTGCTVATAYQEFCQAQKNSNPQLKTSIKKAVVKLKRIKLLSPSRRPTTNSLPTEIENSEDTNGAVYQDLRQDKKNSTLQVKTAKKVVVKLKRCKLENTTTPIAIDDPSKHIEQLNLFQTQRLEQVERPTVPKMKTRYQGTKRVPTFVPKTKPRKAAPKNNVFLKQNELIKDLFITPEDDNYLKEEENAAKSQTKNKNKTHKFFHRTTEKKSPSKEAPVERENIFEFLSQSDTSGSEKGKNKDPAADVIKKLISEGKVRVAVNRKGKGRPIIKRARPKTERKKQLINKVNISQAIGKKKITKTTASKSIINEGHHNNNNQGDTSFAPAPEFFEDDHHDATAYFNDEADADEPISEGGFSRLARSVLLQQTKKYENTRRKDLAEQRRLLEVARKFVSTPAANRKSGNLPTTDLSPIHTLDTQRRPVCPSPWRINDDSHLPSVFNFTKNTSCMPTFSSDYIPPTPTKNKPSTNSFGNNESNVQFDRSANTAQENLATVSRNISDSDSGKLLQDSLGSSNDSNEENKPPPESTSTQTVLNNDENADIFNMRQLPNPRRTLEYRSPLKAINIIEVVTLPPWKKPENNEQLLTSNDCDTREDDKSHKADDLFGFDEYLDPNSDDDAPSNKNNITESKGKSIKRDLHKKLKELKKLRPKDSTHDKTNGTIKPCRLFDDNEGRPKQLLINKMLCSTMINQKNKNSTQEEKNIEKNTACNWEEENMQPIENDFFNDFEPETTLEKKPQRTYARPVKKKRKCRKNFVMFLDSEDSNSDSDEEQHERKKGDQKKKRHETYVNAKQNHELESFVNEFNSMCKEVENYELHVE